MKLVMKKAMKLVNQKAISEKIPSTISVHAHEVSDTLCSRIVRHSVSTPPFDGEEPYTGKTMCRCAVLVPEAGMKYTIVILYEPIDNIIDMLATEEMEKKMIEAFDKILHEVKEHPLFD